MFEGARRILIVKMSSIGDVVHCLPIAGALRRRYPEAYLAWVVQPAAAEVLIGHPALDEVLVVGGQGEPRPGVRPLPSLQQPFALARALRGLTFDLTIDMQGLAKSAWVAYLTGAKDRLGFRNYQEGAFLLCNHRIVPDRRDNHVVEGYLGFAEAVGAPTTPVEFGLATAPEDEARAEELLGGRRDLVALVPGAQWLSKRWPPARFAAALDALHAEFGGEGVVVGAKGDAPLAQEITRAATTPILDLTGKTTLKQLAAVFRRCRLTLANDTGPMYISSAVNTPTVAVFGPTDPRRLGPYGPGHAKVTAALSCAPCRRRECAGLRCLEAVSVEQVVAAARPLLQAASERIRGAAS